jgi:hypothetical protein
MLLQTLTYYSFHYSGDANDFGKVLAMPKLRA